jgi:hypothetical protein
VVHKLMWCLHYRDTLDDPIFIHFTGLGSAGTICVRTALKTINPFVIKIERNIKNRMAAILSASLLFLPDFSPRAQ